MKKAGGYCELINFSGRGSKGQKIGCTGSGGNY